MKDIYRHIGEPLFSPDSNRIGPEPQRSPEREPITPRRLMEANASEEAQELRAAFDQNRHLGNMTLTWECPDARNWRLLGTESLYFHTIANGGDPNKLQKAANSEATKQVAVVAHEPCGGRAAKSLQLTEGVYTPDQDDLHGYISREIDHPSVLQAGIQAKKLSKVTDKEVAALVRNHEDGTLKALAVFNRKDGGQESHIPQELFGDPVPSVPDDDYLLPVLSEDELPENWQEYLFEYDTKRQELLQQDPSVLDRVKIQNPQAFALKTDLRAGEIWMPGIAKPGTIFRMTTPRDRIRSTNGNKKTILTPQDLKLIWRQAEYVISHAIENQGIPEAPFSATNTFIISTPDYALSQRIGLEFAQLPFVNEWIQDERNKILTLQNNSGVLRRAGEMHFQVRNGIVTGFEEVDAETM